MRYSVHRSDTSRPASCSQVDAGSWVAGRFTCTVDVAVTVIESCGSTTSKAITWVPK
jgi:hypothetical protein